MNAIMVAAQKAVFTPSICPFVELETAAFVMTVTRIAVPIEPAICLIVLPMAVPCGIIFKLNWFKPAVCKTERLIP